MKKRLNWPNINGYDSIYSLFYIISYLQTPQKDRIVEQEWCTTAEESSLKLLLKDGKKNMGAVQVDDINLWKCDVKLVRLADYYHELVWSVVKDYDPLYHEGS